MDGDGAYRIVDLQYAVDEFHREADQHAGNQTDNTGADWIDKCARSSDRDQARKEAVARHGSVRFSITEPHVKHGRETARHPGQHRVDGDGCDAEIARAGRPEARTWVKSEPAEGQDEAASQNQDDVMADDGVRLAVP